MKTALPILAGFMLIIGIILLRDTDTDIGESDRSFTPSKPSSKKNISKPKTPTPTPTPKIKTNTPEVTIPKKTKKQLIVISTSFESVAAGQISMLKTKLGSWMAIQGKALIANQYAKTGEQCIHLTGGDATSVSLQLADNVVTTGDLTFWAERWTSRNPFSFRIEKFTDDGWIEIYNGDTEVLVGRAFLSYVCVPLNDENIEQLRFTVKSPIDAGILLDDITISPALTQ